MLLFLRILLFSLLPATPSKPPTSSIANGGPEPRRAAAMDLLLRQRDDDDMWEHSAAIWKAIGIWGRGGGRYVLLRHVFSLALHADGWFPCVAAADLKHHCKTMHWAVEVQQTPHRRRPPTPVSSPPRPHSSSLLVVHELLLLVCWNPAWT